MVFPKTTVVSVVADVDAHTYCRHFCRGCVIHVDKKTTVASICLVARSNKIFSITRLNDTTALFFFLFSLKLYYQLCKQMSKQRSNC